MTVLITGGSRGIGAAIAERLAGQGHDLVLIARSKENLSRTAERIRETYGVQVTAIVADLTKPGIAESLKDRFEKKGITVTGLVNNAGFGHYGYVKDMADRAESMITLNVTTLTELTRTFLVSIEEANGFVINIASVAGMAPMPTMAVYAATKAYVIEFSESLAMESSAQVLCICPGYVETDFHTAAGRVTSNSVRKRLSRSRSRRCARSSAARSYTYRTRRCAGFCGSSVGRLGPSSGASFG